MLGSLSHSFACSFLTYLQLSHGSLSPLVQSRATKLPEPVANQLQHCSIQSTNNSLLGLLSTLEITSTPPAPVKSKYCTTVTLIIQLSLLLSKPTSCLYNRRLPAVSANHDDHQLPRLSRMTTSCLYFQRRPITVSTIGDYCTRRLYYFQRQYDHKSLTYHKINYHMLLLLSRLCSLYFLPGVNLLARTTKIICVVDVHIVPAKGL